MPTPYDTLPYRSAPIEWTAPERLSLASRLHGGPRTRLDAYRVLELGCGNGANLLPMAWYRPQASFVGIDYAESQLSLAQHRAKTLGLEHIEFIHGDFTTVQSHAAFGSNTEPFDYIIAHGVFSWIPETARDAMLASSRTCQRYGLKPLARIRSVALGEEPKRIKTEEMCLGEGLSATLRQAVAGLTLPQERIDDVICDINGERYRNEEWGFVCLRLAHYFEDATAFRSPAEFWGDVGAASGPLSLVLACQAYARGYAKGPRAMIWAGSEAGLRGVAVVEAPGNA